PSSSLPSVAALSGSTSLLKTVPSWSTAIPTVQDGCWSSSCQIPPSSTILWMPPPTPSSLQQQDTSASTLCTLTRAAPLQPAVAGPCRGAACILPGCLQE